MSRKPNFTAAERRRREDLLAIIGAIFADLGVRNTTRWLLVSVFSRWMRTEKLEGFTLQIADHALGRARELADKADAARRLVSATPPPQGILPVNRVSLQGTLANDPQRRSFANGGAVVNLRVQTTESWKDRTSGETKTRAEYHSVAVFADRTQQSLAGAKSGDAIEVTGSLSTRKWQNQSGADRYTTEIVVRGGEHAVQLTSISTPGDADYDGPIPF